MSGAVRYHPAWEARFDLASCFQWPARPVRPPHDAANCGGRTLDRLVPLVSQA